MKHVWKLLICMALLIATAVFFVACDKGSTSTEPVETTCKHDYGTWIDEIAADCENNGTLGHYTCSNCGKHFDADKKELTNLTIQAGHNYGTWINEVVADCENDGTLGHYTCSACGKHFDADKKELTDLTIKAKHNYVNDTCSACGKAKKTSQGLQYTLSNDNSYYIVTGIGTCTDTDLVIPSVYERLPVAEIASSAFSGCKSLTSVEIPDSVTSIKESAFNGCTSLTGVYYNGTAAEWSKMTIYSNNKPLTSATVYCYTETEPTESGNFWHYVDGVPTKW